MMNKNWLPCSVISLVLGASFAVAQPQPQPQPMPEPPSTTSPTEPAPAPDEPDVPPLVTDDTPGDMPVKNEEPERTRPFAKTFALGAGYVYPTDIQLINITGARYVWSDRVMIEPLFEFSYTGDSTDTGGNETTDSLLALRVATEARIALWTRPKTSLSLVAGLGFLYTSEDPDGDDNDISTFGFDVTWGLGVDYWFTQNWGISFTVTNPLFAYRQVAQDNPGGEVTNSNTFVGLLWDDTEARVMMHLYF